MGAAISITMDVFATTDSYSAEEVGAGIGRIGGSDCGGLVDIIDGFLGGVICLVFAVWTDCV